MNTLEQQFIANLNWHKEQDAYIQGRYANEFNGEFKGCSIGCAVKSLAMATGLNLENGNHAEYLEQHLNIPQSVSKMIEFVYERTPQKEATDFSIKAYASCMGKSLSNVTNLQSLWLLDDDTFGVKKYITESEKPAARADYIAHYKENLLKLLDEAPAI